MAYENTEVPVERSQGKIRGLIYAHKGSGVVIVSQRPKEGFEAMVTIADLPFHIRIMASCKPVKTHDGWRERSEAAMARDRDQEERRVWRVLYWHLKAMFEAADSGVIDIRDVILPYVVTRDGRTLSEHLTPRMAEIMHVDTSKLLASGEDHT